MNDDLDRLLTGLGKIEAPEGLERRVLHRLETATPHHRQPVWAWALAAAVLLAGFATIHLAHAPVPKIDLTPRITVTADNTVVPEAIPRETPKRRDPDVRRAAPAQPVAQIEAGFPAPEAPLTDQEKLLLRLAQRPTPSTVAMFDDKVQTQRAEAEKAELDLLNPVQPLVGPKADLTEIKENHNENVSAKH